LNNFSDRVMTDESVIPLVSFSERLLIEVTYDESSSLLKKFKST